MKVYDPKISFRFIFSHTFSTGRNVAIFYIPSVLLHSRESRISLKINLKGENDLL
jgi:hypothetical protein